jgi:hypothetical protein
LGPICDADTLSCSADGEGDGAPAFEPASPLALEEDPLPPEEAADEAEAEGVGVTDEREVSDASAEGVARGDGGATTVEGALADASLIVSLEASSVRSTSGFAALSAALSAGESVGPSVATSEVA